MFRRYKSSIKTFLILACVEADWSENYALESTDYFQGFSALCCFKAVDQQLLFRSLKSLSVDLKKSVSSKRKANAWAPPKPATRREGRGCSRTATPTEGCLRPRRQGAESSPTAAGRTNPLTPSWLVLRTPTIRKLEITCAESGELEYGNGIALINALNYFQI